MAAWSVVCALAVSSVVATLPIDSSSVAAAFANESCPGSALSLVQLVVEKAPPEHLKPADAKQTKEPKLIGKTSGQELNVRVLPVDFLIDHSHLKRESGSFIARLRRGGAAGFVAPPRPRHFHFVNFVKNLMQQDPEAQTPMGVEEHTMKLWTAGFLASLLVLSVFTWCFVRYLQLDAEFPKDDELDVARGLDIWNHLCPAILLGLSTACFFMTVSSVRMVNKEIIKEPQHVQNVGYESVVVTRRPIAEPGKSGYEAGIGVALSGVAACVLALAWRSRGNVLVKMALLGQFALRGATLSAFIAMILEIVGGIVLASTGVEEHGLSLGNLLMMSIVGFSEESAKLFAVFMGTWISAAAVKKASPDSWSHTRLLVETPRALMLAGLCAGFGFMIIENVEYVMAVASTPPMHYSSDNQVDEGANALMIISIFTICVRVVLNLHPWLTGWSSARLAKIVFTGECQIAAPSLSEMMWAIAPPAAAHAAFDFLVGGPGFLALFMPLIFFLFARWSFISQWEEAPNWTAEKCQKPEMLEK